MAYEREDLSRGFRVIPPARMYRRIQARHQQTPLKFLGTPSRFSDLDDGTAPAFETMYMAATVGTAVWETVVRTRMVGAGTGYIHESWLQDSVIVEVRWTDPLVVLDITGDRYLRMNLDPAVRKSDRHDHGQALSRALYLGYQDCDGLYYSSYFTERPCLVLYDRVKPKIAPNPRSQNLMTLPLISERLTAQGLPIEALL